MTATAGRLRRHVAGTVALVLIGGLFLVARMPTIPADEQNATAAKYHFTAMTVALPEAPRSQTSRKVNQAYDNIRGWLSSVGAAIAINDLDGDGLSNDLCLVDARTDQAVVTPTPGAGGTRYAPFALVPTGLPMNDYMAPMGCVPGDYNEDGRRDLLVYYWGRTPILYLAKSDATALDAAAYQPVELVSNKPGPHGEYVGPLWNTNAATIGDFDGDGHVDLFISNYFPDSPILNWNLNGGVEMDQSLSHAQNSGGKYVYRFTGATAGEHPTASFVQAPDALPEDARSGWTLATSATDLDGDGLPELYIANDFGHDHMLYNVSTPGHMKFTEVAGVRGITDPKSKVVGNDSFKGMGVDFGDLNHDGMYDMFLSNITTSWGIEESNFQFMNTAASDANLRAQFQRGIAPFHDVSGESGTAWSGWGWDVKIADFDNSGDPVIAQATGFVKGAVNRWPQLQELATSNDALVSNPMWWPNLTEGDDLGGDQTLHFFAKTAGGRYADIAPQLGLAVPTPTRGIAPGDADGDGRLDFAVARQWQAPVFYRNDSPDTGRYLHLNLTTDAPVSAGPLPAPGSPAIGAEVTVTTPDGRKYIDRVDGSSGHSGRRSQDVNIGLGHDVAGPLQVHLQWRDRTGALRQQDTQLTPGSHTFQLGAQAKEAR